MQATYWMPVRQAAAAGLAVALVALLAADTASAAPARAAAGEPAGEVVAPGAGYGESQGAAPVRKLQRRLERLGHGPGPVDGLYGPLTKAAVERFQRASGLQVDGIVGPLTRRALRAAAPLPMGPGAGYGQHGGSERVRNLQRQLERLGPGPVDGLYGPLTEAAVERFQRASELRADGVVGPQSRRALVRAERSNGGAPDRGADEKRQRERERRAQATPSGQPATGAPVGERPTRAPSTPAAGDLEPDDSAPAPLLTAGLLAVALAALATAVWQLAVEADLSLPRGRAILTKGWARARSLRRFGGTARARVLSGRRFRRRPERPVLDGYPHEAASSRAEPEPIKGASPPPAARPAKGRGDPMRALGYVSAAEPEALPEREQVAAIVALCEALGWRLEDVARDVEQPQENGSLRPPGLDNALERLANGEGSCLVVAQLGRLSRSAAELARMLDWLKQHGIRLVAIDVELDTATPAGRLAADALISVGSLELEQLAPRSAGAAAATGAKGAASGRP